LEWYKYEIEKMKFRQYFCASLYKVV